MGNRREKVAKASGALWKLMDGADGSDMDDEEVRWKCEAPECDVYPRRLEMNDRHGSICSSVGATAVGDAPGSKQAVVSYIPAAISNPRWKPWDVPRVFPSY